MILDMNEYETMLRKLNIVIIYSGPMWEQGIQGLAEMLKAHLELDNLSSSSAKVIFSVFIEQATNVLMYSTEKHKYSYTDKEDEDVPIGMLVLGHNDRVFFCQTRNAMRNENIEALKQKIDLLNSMDNKQLRQYHKEVMRSENENPDSKGAGLGLIEIARRTTSPIKYQFEPINDNLSCFSMYVEIAIKEDNSAV